MELQNIQTVLLDIEGTVCPISFVHDTLFPYALQALPDVIKQKWDHDEFATYKKDFPSDAQLSPDAFLAHVRDLTERDVKIAYLKNLQGYLWQTGYESGVFSTPLFPDVVPRLKLWHQAGAQLAIFSSGSVFAQKLFFTHVNTHDGGSEDLKPLFSAYFDTVNAGPKLEAASYTKIASELSQSTDKILFLSDNVKEVKAALAAGMTAIVVDRPGNAPLSSEDRTTLPVVQSLAELSLPLTAAS